MTLDITALPARHGDALLLSAGPARVLIDGGPSRVWDHALAPALATLGRGGPASIDLMMVSHIDADHITGILELTAALSAAHQGGKPPAAKIRETWFNGFTDALALAEPAPAEAAALSLSSASGPLATLFAGQGDARLVLSSVSQGRRLTDALDTLAIPRNPGFAGGLAIAGARRDDWRCGPLTLRVIGPDMAAVEKLRRKWAQQLPRILAREASEAELVSLDRSVYNLSSIVVVAEAGGRRALLTGDARGDMILEWLCAAGLSGPELHFDILKMPHHGSDRNIDLAFLSAVTADHYLVSGDGKHGNPEPRMFELLFQARRGARYRVHLTYPLGAICAHREFDRDGRTERLRCILERAPAGCIVEPADAAGGARINLSAGSS
ncbi:ComEC/Rec2 family competence protein [Oceanicella sp. SM1341]|uniref:ComEC/Rec2 family competence protein n=1 Tax=Oceanicella sp. SM1341 TaxID=1548889 RepID=UPI000E4B51D9|nr:hypothetical protein [Oceanicella sp. SM1341]